jgi:drug/metabolite transporter (DMT)-like permease
MNIKQYKKFGTLLIILAAFGWSALGSLTLLLSPVVSPLGVSAIRGIWIALAFGLIIFKTKIRLSLKPIVFFGGIAYALSALTYIVSLRLLPVAVAAPLHYTTPAFLVIGLMLFLSRAPSRSDVYGIGLSLIGATILISCGDRASWLGILFALFSAVTWALYLAFQGRFSDDEKLSAVFVAGIILATAGITELDCYTWNFRIWYVVLLIGICSSILPLLFLAWASKSMAPVSISLILLLEPAFAATLAFMINHQVPSLAKLIGLITIVFGAACGSSLLDKKTRVIEA